MTFDSFMLFIPAGLVAYTLIVHTSDIRGAGTDADVVITLYGSLGASGD